MQTLDGFHYRDAVDPSTTMSIGIYNPNFMFIDIDDPINGGGVIVLEAAEILRLIENLQRWHNSL